jgi:hypothetical protein
VVEEELHREEDIGVVVAAAVVVVAVEEVEQMSVPIHNSDNLPSFDCLDWVVR